MKPLPNTLNSTHQPCKGAAQINVLRHNCTSLPPKKKVVRKQTQIKPPSLSNNSSRNSYINTNLLIEIQISVPDVVVPHMHKDLTAWLRSINENTAQELDTSQKCALPKMHTHSCSTIIKVSQNRHIKIVVPEHSIKQYKNAHKCVNDDDFMITFQLCVQPQKNVHN